MRKEEGEGGGQSNERGLVGLVGLVGRVERSNEREIDGGDMRPLRGHGAYDDISIFDLFEAGRERGWICDLFEAWRGEGGEIYFVEKTGHFILKAGKSL